MLNYQGKVFGLIQGNFSFNKIQYFGGFMKTTDHRPTDHLPLTQRANDHLPTNLR